MTLTPRHDIPGTYIVHSGDQTYHVDLRDPFSPTCDCAAWCWTEKSCKHIRLAQGVQLA